MGLTRDHRGTGDFRLTCDGCGRHQGARDGMLAAEVCALASAAGWRLTKKRDTCPGCTRSDDAKARTKAKAGR